MCFRVPKNGCKVRYFKRKNVYLCSRFGKNTTHMTYKNKGLVLGIVSAMTYGMNPLFALPLYERGMNADSVLLFRYGLAAVFLAFLMKRKGIPFSIRARDLLPLLTLALLFAFSSLALFLSYQYMDVGIASTLLFIYPVMVAVLMALFYKERISPFTMSCIALSLSGVGLLSKGSDGMPLSAIGISLVMLSALFYAVYMIRLDHSTVRHYPVLKLTFYGLLLGLPVFLARILLGEALTLPGSPFEWANIFCIALLPTVVSQTLMTIAIQHIGPTPAAILGALEPVTAVFFGVTIFGEQLTPHICLGILLILVAVLLIVGRAPLQHFAAEYLHRR